MAEKWKTERPDRVSVRGREAMRRYGLDRVPLGQVGSPRPGRVADILADLLEDLREGILRNDMIGIQAAYADLDELRLALDAWGIAMTQLISNQDRLAGGSPGGKPE